MAVTGTETYTTVYTYDANNRLLTESKTENSEAVTTTYTYDANGNTLTKSTPAHGEDEASGTTYTDNGFNQLIALTVDGTSVSYAYNAQGIRTAKRVNNLRTAYLLDGGNVVAEVQINTVTDNYLRGVNLVRRESNSETEYYLFNAHGDVVTTTNLNGTVNQAYDYDAFGNEKDPDSLDTNPFRYCGEYLDFETGDYYLRARYYDPSIGRFTQQDTHWNTANMIYGDNPQKINEREDKLGLKTYSYMPQIRAVLQSRNLYAYCLNNPLKYGDNSGEDAQTIWWWTNDTAMWLAQLDGPYAFFDLFAMALLSLGGLAVGSIWIVEQLASIFMQQSADVAQPVSKNPIVKSFDWNGDKHHILKGSQKRGGHDWRKFDIQPGGNDNDNWRILLPILQEVVNKYDSMWSETHNNGQRFIYFAKYMVEQGETIIVRFWIAFDGTLRLSDAFIKTK